MPDKIKTRSTEGKNIKMEIYPHSEIFVREDLGKEGVRRVLDDTE